MTARVPLKCCRNFPTGETQQFGAGP